MTFQNIDLQEKVKYTRKYISLEYGASIFLTDRLPPSLIMQDLTDFLSSPTS